jgi:3D (Asp-Asp-Asp) domain-containing protein
LKTCDRNLAVRHCTKIQARRIFTVAGVAVVAAATIGTAILAKEANHAPALIAVTTAPIHDEPQGGPIDESDAAADNAPVIEATIVAESSPSPAMSAEMQKFCSDPEVRWFNGRPAKPAQVFTMTVTAYSPDAKSCGDSADGITATLHHVSTNDFHLVAADPTLLPYGSMLSIPGYADGKIVPVLDCGGAIKGHHIDLLFPTDAEACEWGVKKLRVTVWQYIDGLPAENPRKLR